MDTYKRILVVDDEEQVVFVLRHSLKKLGPLYEIVTAADGQEALEKMKESHVDLLITDIAMPGMDGLTLTEAVRARDPETKVVWVTAYGEWKDVAEQMGVRHYMLKPVDVDEIRRVAREELEPEPEPAGDGVDEVAHPALGGVPEPGPRGEPAKERLAKILVMDDNDNLRRLFSRALDKAGYATHQAATIHEAREWLEREHFEVFLCDIRMGSEGLGTDLLREQLEALNKAGTQVIMVSAESHYRDLCEQMGIDFYIEKPVAIPPLVTLVNRLTGIR
ncbi:MAG: response regulator [Thermoflexales bacterium]|nr:response regulator [Thermoflexales bacterium]